MDEISLVLMYANALKLAYDLFTVKSRAINNVLK